MLMLIARGGPQRENVVICLGGLGSINPGCSAEDEGEDEEMSVRDSSLVYPDKHIAYF